MDLKTLKEMKAKLDAKITAAFEDFLESASDEAVAKYENLLKQGKEIDEQIMELEALEEKNKGGSNHGQRIAEGERGSQLVEEKEFFKNLIESVSLGTTFTGMIPRSVVSKIQEKKEQIANIRKLCTVHPATGDYTIFVEGDGVTVTYIGEGAQIGETSPTIKPIGLGALKIGALIKVSREYLSDLSVDVEAYLINAIAKGLAKFEDKEILFGAGTSSSKTALRGIATNTTNIKQAAASDTVTWEEVKAAIQMIKGYRKTATIVCSQEFLDICHNFKSGNTYLFPQQNEITSILGVKVEVSDVFPTITAGTILMVIGDFSYYHITDRQVMEIVTLKERYADTDQIGIRAIERTDGDFVKEAFAVLKTAAASTGD